MAEFKCVCSCPVCIAAESHGFFTESHIISQRALSQKVLAVAVKGNINDWAAYIDAVPGQTHSKEGDAVMEKGEKLPKHIAVAIFPSYDPKLYRE